MFNLVLAISFAMVPQTDAAEKSAAEKTATNQRAAYLVVPNDFTKMGTANRQRLGINGSFVRIQFGAKQESGFRAWLTVQQAAKLRTEDGVSAVKPISAAQIDNKFSPKAHNVVIVRLAPNCWNKNSAPEGSYESTEQVIAKWQKTFGKRVTKIAKGKAAGTIRIEFKTGKQIAAQQPQGGTTRNENMIINGNGGIIILNGKRLILNGNQVIINGKQIIMNGKQWKLPTQNNFRKPVNYENVLTTVKKHRQVGGLSGTTIAAPVQPRQPENAPF